MNQPATKQPTTKQPTTKQPIIKQPATKQPTTKQPTIKQQATKQPTTQQPATNQTANHQAAIPSSRPWPTDRESGQHVVIVGLVPVGQHHHYGQLSLLLSGTFHQKGGQRFEEVVGLVSPHRHHPDGQVHCRHEERLCVIGHRDRHIHAQRQTDK